MLNGLMVDLAFMDMCFGHSLLSFCFHWFTSGVHFFGLIWLLIIIMDSKTDFWSVIWRCAVKVILACDLHWFLVVALYFVSPLFNSLVRDLV